MVARMRDSDWRKGGNGVLTVPEIIKKSSNVGVSTLIDNAYASNPDQFVAGLQRIGIMEDLHIPIPGYKKPRIRYRKDNPDRWYGTTLPWMSIGYETQVPPISTLTFYNGVANGGKLVAPRFVKRMRCAAEMKWYKNIPPWCSANGCASQRYCAISKSALRCGGQKTLGTGKNWLILRTLP